jgi:hypothetical protein
MKSWYQFSSTLMVAALLASATAAEEVTPWGYAYAGGAGAPAAASGVALTGCQNGSCGVTTGAPSYGYNVQGYGAPGYGAPRVAKNYGVPAPAYTAPAYSAPGYYNAPSYPAQAATRTPTPALGFNAYAAPSTVASYNTQPVVRAGAVTSGPDGGAPAAAPFATAEPVYTGGYVASGSDWGAPVVGCADPAVAQVNNCPRWFGGVYGLIMDRVDSDNVYFALDPALPSRLYLSSRDAAMNNTGGVEARIGKTFDCCRWGLEFVYWQLFPEEQCSSVYTDDVPAPTVFTTGNYQDVYLDFSGGWNDSVSNYFNDGSIQMMVIHRTFDVQNFELNLLSGPLCPAPSGCDDCGGQTRGGCGLRGRCGRGRYGANCGQPQRWQAGWLFGFRYFRFDEGFFLGVDNGDGYLDYSYNGGDEEFFHLIDTTNDLYGFQLGLNLNYCITQCLQLDFGSKFGFYANHMTNYQSVFNTTGPAYVGAAQEFTVNSSRDDIAFLGELRAGAGYKIGDHCRLTGGYRAVAVTNVALPLDQLPEGRTLGSLNYAHKIHHDASLILHGAYAGLEFAW